MNGHDYVWASVYQNKNGTVKATILGIRMCSTGLLLWRNQRGSTCYTMTLYKRDSTGDIFL